VGGIISTVGKGDRDVDKGKERTGKSTETLRAEKEKLYKSVSGCNWAGRFRRRGGKTRRKKAKKTTRKGRKFDNRRKRGTGATRPKQKTNQKKNQNV